MCYEFQCNSAKTEVTIKVSAANPVVCTVAGETKTLDNSEYKGNIVCPNPAKVCASAGECSTKNYCNRKGVCQDDTCICIDN